METTNDKYEMARYTATGKVAGAIISRCILLVSALASFVCFLIVLTTKWSAASFLFLVTFAASIMIFKGQSSNYYVRCPKCNREPYVKYPDRKCPYCKTVLLNPWNKVFKRGYLLRKEANIALVILLAAFGLIYGFFYSFTSEAMKSFVECDVMMINNKADCRDYVVDYQGKYYKVEISEQGDLLLSNTSEYQGEFTPNTVGYFLKDSKGELSITNIAISRMDIAGQYCRMMDTDTNQYYILGFSLVVCALLAIFIVWCYRIFVWFYFRSKDKGEKIAYSN